MKKTKLLMTLLVVMLGIMIMSFTASAAYENSYTNTGDQRKDIIGVAKTQLGYKEGSNNDTKYGDWYGLPNQPWCAMFVTWCAREAGIPSNVLKSSAVASPKSGYFNISYYRGNSYTPKAGDLFFTESFSHVGLVYYIDGSYFYTIEGNSNNTGSSEGTSVVTNKRKISSYYFGVPDYQNLSEPSQPVLTISTANSSDKDVVFSWTSTTNTDHYDLRVYNHGEYNVGAPYYEFDIPYGTTSTTMRLPAGKYAAYVSAVTKYGVWTGSEWVIFSVEQKHTHNFTEAIDKNPTCTSAGVRTYTCSTCGNKYTESVAATGHTVVTDKAVAAYCTTAGKTEGSHCSVCNTVIKAQIIIKALGHSEGTWIVDKDATCMQAGSRHTSCVRCDKILTTDEIPATGHTDENHDGICDNCQTTNCSCGCHKTGIAKFFWAIGNFFRKLFGNRAPCICGAEH